MNVLCIGLALTDAETDKDLLPDSGRFNYIDRAAAQKLLGENLDFRCGGSAANTAKAMARHGQCFFYGAVGHDERGRTFAGELSDHGVSSMMDIHADDITGFTILLKTPQPKGIHRKSTRLNSSHSSISYAVFCLKKKN